MNIHRSIVLLIMSLDLISPYLYLDSANRRLTNSKKKSTDIMSDFGNESVHMRSLVVHESYNDLPDNTSLPQILWKNSLTNISAGHSSLFPYTELSIEPTALIVIYERLQNVFGNSRNLLDFNGQQTQVFEGRGKKEKKKKADIKCECEGEHYYKGKKSKQKCKCYGEITKEKKKKKKKKKKDDDHEEEHDEDHGEEHGYEYEEEDYEDEESEEEHEEKPVEKHKEVYVEVYEVDDHKKKPKKKKKKRMSKGKKEDKKLKKALKKVSKVATKDKSGFVTGLSKLFIEKVKYFALIPVLLGGVITLFKIKALVGFIVAIYIIAIVFSLQYEWSQKKERPILLPLPPPPPPPKPKPTAPPAIPIPVVPYPSIPVGYPSSYGYDYPFPYVPMHVPYSQWRR